MFTLQKHVCLAEVNGRWRKVGIDSDLSPITSNVLKKRLEIQIKNEDISFSANECRKKVVKKVVQVFDVEVARVCLRMWRSRWTDFY